MNFLTNEIKNNFNMMEEDQLKDKDQLKEAIQFRERFDSFKSGGNYTSDRALSEEINPQQFKKYS